MKDNIYKRLALAESFALKSRSEQVDFLRERYERACAYKNEKEAAEAARALRNKLLEMSDAHMCVDRQGFETGSAVKFLASFAKMLTSPWALYRTALRDLPQTDGFPFDVTCPTPPDEVQV